LHLGHLFLFVSLLSLGFIGIFHKLADHFKCRPKAINVTVFLWAGVLILIYVLITGRGPLVLQAPKKLYLVAGLCGFLASTAILSFQAGLRHGKISTSWVVINLSTALPTVLSILVYKERVTIAKGFALILVIAAILLLWKDKQQDEKAGSRLNPST
jgi:drug/metabolite transporter (DMT)-like permease